MTVRLRFPRTRTGIALLTVTTLGAALRFATLDQQSYWYDEAVTATLVDGSFEELLSGIVDTESTPPLYYMLAWLWAQAVGSDELGLRVLSATIGTLTIPVAFAAGRVAATVRIGLAAALLAAVSPMLIWYAQEARAYVLLAFLCGASFVLFVRARDEPTARRLTAWAVVAALALATHYFALFVAAAEGALLAWEHPRSRRLRWALAGVVAAGLALLPLAAVQASNRRLGWVGAIDLAERVGEALQRLVTAGPPSSWAGATGSEVAPHAWVAAALVLAVAGGLLALRALPRERSGACLALLVAACGIGIPVAMAIVADLATDGDGDYFLDRNVLGAWVPLAVFVASGLAARRAGAVGAACLAGIVGWSLWVYTDVVTTPSLQRDDWRGVARALDEDGTPKVVVVYPAYQAAALQRQLPKLVPLEEPIEVQRVVLVLAGFDRPPATFRLHEGFSETSSDRVQHFVLVEYRSGDAASVRPEDLARDAPAESDLAVLVPGPP